MAAAPHAGAHIEPRFGRKNQSKSTKNVALHFRENVTLQQAKSITYLTSTRPNCRRWVRSQTKRWRRCLDAFPHLGEKKNFSGGYVVRDAAGQAIAYLYARSTESEAV